MAEQERGCNTTASVPASQAGYEGSTPFTRSRLAIKFFYITIMLLALAGCKTVGTVPTYTATTPHFGGVYHYVKGGETIWSISNLYGVDINNIVKANNLEDARDITRGQRLLIPGVINKQYTVKSFVLHEPFIWPLDGAIISYFGSKIDRTGNKGIDIRAREGSNVKAARTGKVVFCDEWLKGFGKTVILDHGDNFQTVYAYNSMILVNLGDLVEQNKIIAKVGKGGRAKEPCLHFEIRRDGEPQNPFYYLSR